MPYIGSKTTVKIIKIFLMRVEYIMQRLYNISECYNSYDICKILGYKPTVENEANGCVLSKPEEILELFKAFNRNEKVFFTFDIQNLWQMGTYPSVEVCEILTDITGYFHLRGSQSLVPGGHTYYGTTLEDASWPVVEVTKKAITERKGVVTCLNPIKGDQKGDYDYENITKRDWDYLRNNIKEVR